MDIRARFGRILRQRRKALDLTQEEVASRAETAPVYISELERGVYNPTLAVLFGLGRALDIHPSDLLRELPLNSALQKGAGRVRLGVKASKKRTAVLRKSRVDRT